MQETQAQKFKDMTERPIPGLILSLSAPTIVSMLVTAIYNTADTIFVSRLGTSASGAVGIVFSLMAIIQAVGFTLGMGSGSLISRSLGKRDLQSANRYLASALFAAVTCGLIITVVCLGMGERLVRLLGATDTIAPYAADYAGIVVFGAPIMACSFVLNNVLRAEGKASLAMIGIMAGGILNLALDPLLIYAFDMGISGAALATVISQAVSCSVLASVFLRKRSITRISIKNISHGPMVYGRIIKTGMPSLARQGIASIATIALNVHAAKYGDAAVSAMSIVGRVFMFIMSIMIGIGQGFQPVAGYNYGAGNTGRVKQAFWVTCKLGLVSMATTATACFLLARPIMRAFIGNTPDVIEIGMKAMRFQCVAMLLLPISTTTNMLYQSIGKAWGATIMSCMRQGIAFLPCLLLLERNFGLLGVQAAQPLSDIVTLAVTLPFMFYMLRDLTKRQQAKDNSIQAALSAGDSADAVQTWDDSITADTNNA